jgi:hypothetical protein
LESDREWRYYQELALVMDSGWVLDFLVAGIDDAGEAHLWTVTEGGKTDCVSMGFASIGAGATRATFSLGRWAKEAARELPIAIYAAFEAKKDAECLESVNDKTDLVILQNGAKSLSWGTKELEPLEEAYKEMRPKELSKQSREGIQRFLECKMKPPSDST